MIAERQTLAALAADQRRRFEAGESASVVVHERAAAVDEICTAAFAGHIGVRHQGTHAVALVAVGGYGRGELHPYSDVDVLVLVEGAAPTAAIERFIAHLWDCGL